MYLNTILTLARFGDGSHHACRAAVGEGKQSRVVSATIEPVILALSLFSRIQNTFALDHFQNVRAKRPLFRHHNRFERFIKKREGLTAALVLRHNSLRPHVRHLKLVIAFGWIHLLHRWIHLVHLIHRVDTVDYVMSTGGQYT